MKKTIFNIALPLILTLGIVQSANSQAALFILLFGEKVASENFYLSMDFGLNFSNLQGYEDGSMLIGPNFGLGTHIKLSDSWYLNPEFKPLSSRGVSDVINPIPLPPEYADSETGSDVRLRYMEIPILAQYRLENGLYFSAGPQISFLSRARQLTEIVLPSGVIVDVEQDIKDDFNGIDYSVPVEIGYQLAKPLAGKGVEVRLRYNHGLNDVFKDSNISSANNSSFQFFLTFPFIEEQEETPEND